MTAHDRSRQRRIPKVSGSTSTLAPRVLGGLPDVLREELIGAINEVERNYREGRWGPAELNGGKLCEVVYSIVRGHVDGLFPERAHKPEDMSKACRDLEKLPSSSVSRAIRIQIPRMIVALYEIRNSRSVGHVGGDVDPNRMDATVVLAMSRWLVSELVRIFNRVDSATATAFVDALTDRETPAVWVVGDRKRVLNTTLSMREKTLLLLHATPGPVPEATLCSWVEHSNPSVYRRDVLRVAHQARLIEYEEGGHIVHISPAGIRFVEDRLAQWIA